jgi:hypothetical protein
MYARVRKIDANRLMPTICNNINIFRCQPRFEHRWLNCHIWPTDKMVFGQMANSQYEDKDFPKVT